MSVMLFIIVLVASFTIVRIGAVAFQLNETVGASPCGSYSPLPHYLLSLLVHLNSRIPDYRFLSIGGKLGVGRMDCLTFPYQKI